MRDLRGTGKGIFRHSHLQVPRAALTHMYFCEHSPGNYGRIYEGRSEALRVRVNIKSRDFLSSCIFIFEYLIHNFLYHSKVLKIYFNIPMENIFAPFFINHIILFILPVFIKNFPFPKIFYWFLSNNHKIQGILKGFISSIKNQILNTI